MGSGTPPVRGVWISLSYATFGIEVAEDGYVEDAAPIARWMIGKHYTHPQRWVERKGGVWRWLPILD